MSRRSIGILILVGVSVVTSLIVWAPWRPDHEWKPEIRAEPASKVGDEKQADPQAGLSSRYRVEKPSVSETIMTEMIGQVDSIVWFGDYHVGLIRSPVDLETGVSNYFEFKVRQKEVRGVIERIQKAWKMDPSEPHVAVRKFAASEAYIVLPASFTQKVGDDEILTYLLRGADVSFFLNERTGDGVFMEARDQ